MAIGFIKEAIRRLGASCLLYDGGEAIAFTACIQRGHDSMSSEPLGRHVTGSRLYTADETGLSLTAGSLVRCGRDCYAVSGIRRRDAFGKTVCLEADLDPLEDDSL